MRIGLGVGHDTVRAVIDQRGRVVWCAEDRRTRDEDLADSITRLFARLPRRAFRRPRVVAALSPVYVQVRGVCRSSATVAELQQAVRASPHRFFLRARGALRVSQLHTAGSYLWGAAFEDKALRAIREGCRRSRLRVDAYVPTIVAIAERTGSGLLKWRDGEVTAEMTMSKGEMLHASRTAGPHADCDLGGREEVTSQHFADAIGAARCTDQTPLLLRNDVAGAIHAPRRLALAFAAALSAVAAIVAPDVAVGREATRTRIELMQLGTAAAVAAPFLSRLREVSRTLAMIDSFSQSRPSMLQSLSLLASTIPESTAIMTLRIDSVAGSVVILSTHGAAVLQSLSSIRSIQTAQIVGAITRERIGNVALQRVAIRFTLRHAIPVSKPSTGSTSFVERR